jgi:dienelactone hydrolase
MQNHKTFRRIAEAATASAPTTAGTPAITAPDAHAPEAPVAAAVPASATRRHWLGRAVSLPWVLGASGAATAQATTAPASPAATPASPGMTPAPPTAATATATALANTTQRTGLTAADNALPVFFEPLRARMRFSHGWREGVSPSDWRSAGRAAARALMLPPDTDAPPWQATVLDAVDRGSHRALRLSLQLTADSRVFALLLEPKARGPHPAALVLHDHGSRFDIGKEKMVEPWGDPAREEASRGWAARYFGGRFPGDELARRGHVVLAVDALGWGDRSVPGFQRESQQALACNLMNLGQSWAGLIAWEDLRAVQFLASLPQVDRRRVAAVGFSMGAFRAWQLAALSDEVTATVACCWMATMQGLMVPGNNQLRGQSAFTMLHPGIGRCLDYPDVAGLAAPRPMLLQAGAQDPLFPPAVVDEAWGRMHRIWQASGAASALATHWWPQGHVFDVARQDQAFDWLQRQG